MKTEVEAIYENGVFRPLEPVEWSEQQRVRVPLEAAESIETNQNGAQPASDTWTEEKNQRRADLVDKDIDGTLSPEEKIQLDTLQKKMQAYVRRVAPLPLDDLRALHQQLLEKAKQHEEASKSQGEATTPKS